MAAVTSPTDKLVFKKSKLIPTISGTKIINGTLTIIELFSLQAVLSNLIILLYFGDKIIWLTSARHYILFMDKIEQKVCCQAGIEIGHSYKFKTGKMSYKIFYFPDVRALLKVFKIRIWINTDIRNNKNTEELKGEIFSNPYPVWTTQARLRIFSRWCPWSFYSKLWE